MPSEIMSMILANLINMNLHLDLPHQKDLFNVLDVRRHVRAEAIAAIPRQTRCIVAKSWIRIGDDRPAIIPPKSLLQGLRHIRLDFSGLDHSELSATSAPDPSTCRHMEGKSRTGVDVDSRST